jgi:hypothetical protein
MGEVRGRRGKHVGFSLGNFKEKRQFGKPRRVCEDNIKANLKEIGWNSSFGVNYLRILK